MSLSITSHDLAIVCSILARNLPPEVEVAVFGSRADGHVKPASDLDLALMGDGPLPLALLAELAEAFDESPLPWKVDLVDRAAVSEAFERIIGQSAVPLDFR